MIQVLFIFRKNNRKIPDSDKDRLDHFICRFVVDGANKKIGESIAINHDILIIKSGSKLLGVPVKHIEEKDSLLLVKGLIDYKKAYELGDEWKQKASGEKFENSEG